ncbi:MAG: DedA family protein [Hyphomicrobiaceae bacterium]
MFEGLIDAVMAFVRQNAALIEIVLFALAFLESIILTSWLVPSTVIFVGIGALAGADGGVLAGLVIAGALGSFAGDLASYALGRRLSGELPRMWPISKHPAVLMRAEDFFRKWGLLAVLVAKFVGPLRPIVPMLAGTSRHRIDHFAAASAAASLTWSSVVLVPAYYGAKVVAG